MLWIYLILAAVFEVFWIIFLKMSSNWEIIPIVMTFISLVASGFFMLLAAQFHLGMEVLYPIWVGMATVFIILAQSFLYGSVLSWQQGVFIVITLIGIAGLKVYG